MTFWIILIAAVLIGYMWWQGSAKNQNNGSSKMDNKNNIHYHQSHLATEASEELTPEIPSGTNNESNVYYHQTHLDSKSSQESTSQNLSGTNNNKVQQNQNQTSQALTLYDPSSMNNNKNDGVYYHQTHLAAQTAQTESPTSGNLASEEGIQQVQQQIEASYQQNQEQNK